MRSFTAVLVVSVAAACSEGSTLEVAPGAGDHGEDEGDPTDACSGFATPDQGDFGRRLALTFDDGPVPGRTDRVIDILRRHQVPATFFVNGVRLIEAEAQALYDEIRADPLFLIGNHAWTHARLTELSDQERRAELGWSAGADLGLTPPAPYVRFPFGAADCDLVRLVHEADQAVLGWNVDSHDWSYVLEDDGTWWSRSENVPEHRRGDMPGHVRDQLVRGLGTTGGGVALFHDGRLITVEHLEDLIVDLRADGVEFVALDDAEVFPRLAAAVTPDPES